jgi:4-hydroxymandelate oxidase
VWAGNVTGDAGPTANDMFRAGVTAASPAWSWAQLSRAAGQAGLPWIAKGILTGPAALAALDAGAAAILVSNHGGRQVDPAPASLDVLPEVVSAVAGRAPVLLDSGIRSGADVLLALALGADAVVIGRLAAYGLAAAGEAGVRRVIELLAEELRTLMVLAGLPDIKSITSEAVARR